MEGPAAMDDVHGTPLDKLPASVPTRAHQTDQGASGRTEASYADLLRSMEEEEQAAKREMEAQAEARLHQLQTEAEIAQRKRAAAERATASLVRAERAPQNSATHASKPDISPDIHEDRPPTGLAKVLHHAKAAAQDKSTWLLVALTFALLYFLPRIRAALPARLIDASTGRANMYGTLLVCLSFASIHAMGSQYIT